MTSEQTETAGTNKPIRLSQHAAAYEERRGFIEDEVRDTILTSTWNATRGNRLEASKDFPYNGIWNGAYYATKRVRSIFVDEPDEIVVVTVYTYYF
jgi:hypothetical protein